MSYDVAIVGAGYVGVPLAQVFADAGKTVLLVDVDASRVDRLNRGEATSGRSSETLKRLVENGLAATTDYDTARVDAPDRAPDAARGNAGRPRSCSRDRRSQKRLRPGHLVVLGRPTGTTREQVLPILEAHRPEVGTGFCLRSPGGGRAGRTSRRRTSQDRGDHGRLPSARGLYGSAIDTVYRVSSPESPS